MEKLLKISVIYCCLATTSRKYKITACHRNIANHRSILMRLPWEFYTTFAKIIYILFLKYRLTWRGNSRNGRKLCRRS